MQEPKQSKRGVPASPGARSTGESDSANRPSGDRGDETMVSGNKSTPASSRSRDTQRKTPATPRKSSAKAKQNVTEEPLTKEPDTKEPITELKVTPKPVPAEVTQPNARAAGPLSLPPEERSTLLHEMINSLCDDLEYAITQNHVQPAEALEELREFDATVRLGELQQTPLAHVKWRHLRALEMENPALTEKYWLHMKRVARDNIRSGHFAARGAGLVGQHPWQRAMFLALREEFSEEWQPRDGIERSLIDQMAQAYYQYVLWSERATRWGVFQPTSRDERQESARLPMVTEVEAMEQAMGMADKFQRIFLRCQRALRDSRRFSVNIQGAKQVNIGEHQINVSDEAPPNPKKMKIVDSE